MSFILTLNYPTTFPNIAKFAEYCALVPKDTKLSGDTRKMVNNFLNEHFFYSKQGQKVTLHGRNYQINKKGNIKDTTHLAALLIINDVLETCANYDSYLDNFDKNYTLGDDICTVYYRRSFLNVLCGQVSETFYADEDIMDKVYELSKSYSGLQDTYELYKQELLRLTYNNITNSLKYISNRHLMVQNRTFLMKRKAGFAVANPREQVLLSEAIGKTMQKYNMPNMYALITSTAGFRYKYWRTIITEFNDSFEASEAISAFREVISFSFRKDYLQSMYEHYLLATPKKFNITHELLNENRIKLIDKILHDYARTIEDLPETLVAGFKLKEKYNCVSELVTELLLPHYY